MRREDLPAQRGRRLSAKGAHDTITGIAEPLQHAELQCRPELVCCARDGGRARRPPLGHARLETTRPYTQPTAEDRAKAIDLLVVDE